MNYEDAFTMCVDLFRGRRVDRDGSAAVLRRDGVVLHKGAAVAGEHSFKRITGVSPWGPEAETVVEADPSAFGAAQMLVRMADTQGRYRVMSEGLNQVVLLGNLGADPDLRYTQGGQAVLNLRLATTESYLDKDKTRQERTEWHQVVVWGAQGEALSKILVKGSTILVVGGLRTTSYEDKDGNKRWKTEIHAKTVCLTGSRPKSAEEPAQPARQVDARQADARQPDTRRADPRRSASRSDDDMPF